MEHELLSLHQEVQEAIHSQKPIVAIDASMIAHNIPYPENLKTILQVEQLIRQNGAIPATICLHNGKIQIGTNEPIMQQLFSDPAVLMASKCDIAYVLSRKITSHVTVAAAIWCAEIANISIVVTGGIGGLHNQINDDANISADLLSLSKSSVALVCSGAKSILDLPKTIAILKNHGIPIIGYKTNEFPVFYSHSSGITLLQHLNNVDDIAKVIYCQSKLYPQCGMIVANPIPTEAEIPDARLVPILKQAQHDSHHINGKAITPLLLKRIEELSTNQIIYATIQLIKNNATLSSALAVAYKNEKNKTSS